ncbi:hypothetical protein ACHWQZ_G001338 [Mnemiopsis leidyi]
MNGKVDHEPEEESASGQITFSDVWLEINEALDYPSLVRGVHSTAQRLLPTLIESHTFFLTPDTGEIELYGTTGCLGKILPRSGIVFEAMKGSLPLVKVGLQMSDPLYSVLDISRSNIKDVSRVTVIIAPLKQDSRRLGCFVLVTSLNYNMTNQENIKLLQRYVQSAAVRVVEHQTTKYERGRAEKMLNFCVDLYQMNSTNLIETILKQVRENTDAMFTALMVTDCHEQELTVHLYDGGFQLDNITIDLGSSMYKYLLESNKPANMVNVSKDPRFNPESDTLTGRDIQTLVALPLFSESKFKTKSIICAFNKRGLKFNTFTKGDEDALTFTMNFCSPILTNALTFEQQLSSRERTQALLKVAQNLFTRFDNVHVLLREIMQEARMLTQAERCSVFLVDKMTNELVAKVFDGTLVDGEEIKRGPEIRLPINKGVAGHVAMTGKLLNIKDAYSHPLFYRGVDEDTGFVTRNILCFPIKDDTGVIGVAQLCNKTGGKYFSRHDEEAALSFSVYCGISISNSLLFKKVQDAQYRSKLASDLMIYHMQVPQTELDGALQEVHITCTLPPNFSSLLFPTYIVEEESKSISLAYHMFEDLGLINRWQFSHQTLTRFLLMVKRGYRDPPYHNWMHAFCVGHFFYSLCKAVDISKYMTDIEVLAMLIACFCHDLDHRGTTNAFQVASRSVLACLYSSEGSVMERHHFAQTFCILNTSGCNIIECLDTENYKTCLDNIQKIILATDLAQHLRIISQQKEMAATGYDFNNPHHHFLLLSLVITSCDLSINVKMFEESSVIVRDHIYSEFFSEGDMEKELGRTPMQQNDRKKACIPSLQIKFNDFILAPLYTLLIKLLPPAQIVVDQLEENRLIWESISIKHNQEENHNCVKYDNYTSCKKSQQHIEKKLGNYANKLNSKSFSKKKDLEQKAAEWNNGLDEAGAHNNTREHYMLIAAYNEALLETYELDLDSEILSGHPSTRPFSIVTRKCSDDSIVKRRGLQLSRSSPQNNQSSCTSPPTRSCRSTPTTPLNRADKPGGESGVEAPKFQSDIDNHNDNDKGAAGSISSFSDCSLDTREPLEHNFQNIIHAREEWI